MVSRIRFVAPCAVLVSLVAGHSAIASDFAPSRPIIDSSWEIFVETPATTTAETIAQNDAGPQLVNVESTPATEEAPAPESVTVPQADAAPLAGEAVEVGSSAAPQIIPAVSYIEAYNSVPFSRTEYEANPGYRHEAAMEIMFRQLRPTTIVKQYTPRAIRYPDFYQYPFARYPYTRIGVQNSWNAYGIPYPLYAR
ncbi:MAG: hypothetical protein KDA36_10040 [Planctomycetaceae bacterium]|nr:hypothetical protein [Planctomycetaceae bacterium]